MAYEGPVRLAYKALATSVAGISIGTSADVDITGTPISATVTPLPNRNLELTLQLVVIPAALNLVEIGIKDVTAGVVIGRTSTTITAGSAATITLTMDYTPPSSGARTFRPVLRSTSGTTTVEVFGADVNAAISMLKVNQL